MSAEDALLRNRRRCGKTTAMASAAMKIDAILLVRTEDEAERVRDEYRVRAMSIGTPTTGRDGPFLIDPDAAFVALSAATARAEKAERERDEARASNALMVEALTERTQQRDETEERVQRSCDHARELLLRSERDERLLALYAPVVEAAEKVYRWSGAQSRARAMWGSEAADSMLAEAAKEMEVAVRAMRAARKEAGLPQPDAHVAVSPEAVDDTLRGVCGNQDRSSPRRCDRPAGHEGEHDQSNWPTGEMAPRGTKETPHA